MATLITPDGTQKVVHPKAGIGKAFTYDELQHIVQGYPDKFSLTDNKVGITNGRGRIQGLQSNPRASLATGYELFGNVLICENCEIN